MEAYDVVIVGSGLGGLECGVMLAREGRKVLILEKNKQIGGNLQIFSRNKRIFDTGIHYIGGLAPGENLYKYFCFLGIMDGLKLRRLDQNGFDIISFDDDPTEYKYGQGYANFIDTLAEYFPAERSGIEKYCHEIKEACKAFPMYNVEISDDAVSSMRVLSLNARDFIADCTSNKKLQKILAGNNGLYAGIGDKTPFYMHALVLNSYIESSWRCVGGGSQIGKLLLKKLREYGGEIMKHAEVTQFEFDENRIKHALLKDGRKIAGDLFISNIHPSITLDMVGEGHLRRAFVNRVKSLEESVSVFIVYLVIKPGCIPYFNYNRYHFIDDRVWDGADYTEADWPRSYALFTGGVEEGQEYLDSMIMMAYMRSEETEEWGYTHNRVGREEDRGQAYEAFKKEKAERLIDELEKRYPNIREQMETYYTSTPLTYRDYIGTPDGSLYGIVKDHNNPMHSFIAPKTKIPNLYFTGQNLNMHGVLGVTISAITTCGELLGRKYLMEQVLAMDS